MNERILEIRKDAGLTQVAFAERLGIDSNHVSFLETGRRNPSEALAFKICRVFGVRPEWLATGEGPMHEDLAPAAAAADRVRRLMEEMPESTAAAVIGTLLSLDPLGPEWELLGSLLRKMTTK